MFYSETRQHDKYNFFWKVERKKLSITEAAIFTFKEYGSSAKNIS